jgi:hypothetical protein
VEEVPGLFVLGVFGTTAVGSEEEFELPPQNAKTACSEDPGCPVGGFEGNDEPDIGWNNVSGDEVELVGAVGGAV